MSSDKYEHGRAGRGGGAEAGASKPGLWRQNLQYGKDLNFGLFFVPSFGIGGALRRLARRGLRHKAATSKFDHFSWWAGWFFASERFRSRPPRAFQHRTHHCLDDRPSR